MRKLFIIFALLVPFVLGATDRIITPVIKMNIDETKPRSFTYTYNGVAADSITANQDTVRLQVMVNKAYASDIYFNVTYDLVGTADTTLKQEILGKVFEGETYTSITSNTAAAIAADNSQRSVSTWAVASKTYAVTTTESDSAWFVYDTTKVYPGRFGTVVSDSATLFQGYSLNYVTIANTLAETPAVHAKYRIYALDMIISGDDNTGSGVTIDKVEIFIERKQ